jgi:hypothetical protein
VALVAVADMRSFVIPRGPSDHGSGRLALETFCAWGSTRVLDADLTPLTRLRRLKEVRMRNRRAYEPHVGDVVASVT